MSPSAKVAVRRAALVARQVFRAWRQMYFRASCVGSRMSLSGYEPNSQPPPLARPLLDGVRKSGTTALAAKEHGRAFIGIELSPAFCDLAETRKARQAGKRAARHRT